MMLQVLSFTMWIFIQISAIHDNISLHKCGDAEYTKLKVDGLKVGY